MFDISVEFGKSALLKYFEHSFKDTDTIVKENEQYFESLQTVKRIIIFGHSLATVDEKYIRKINSIVSSKCNWFVFYRNASEKFEKKERMTEIGIDKRKIHPFHVNWLKKGCRV